MGGENKKTAPRFTGRGFRGAGPGENPGPGNALSGTCDRNHHASVRTKPCPFRRGNGETCFTNAGGGNAVCGYTAFDQRFSDILGAFF